MYQRRSFEPLANQGDAHMHGYDVASASVQ